MNDLPDCRPDGDLRRFLLGQLPEADAVAIEQHLSGCSRCLDTIGAMRASDTLLKAMQSQATADPHPEADVVRQLMQKLSRLHPAPSAEHLEKQVSFAPPQSPEELGRLGGYCILKMLGVGGMGIVFEAEDPRLKRRVALKVMKPALAKIPANRERFLREAQATAAIEHDHVVTIHQVGEDGGVPFLTMPLLKGQTLEDALERADHVSLPLPLGEGRGEGVRALRTLPIGEVLRIGREIASGLAAAHAQGLTHRDVKPANIWLEKTGRVKILDFGLARPQQDNAHLTQSGLIAGTPQYMAPEQATGKKVDSPADLFALGCVLYRLTTGRLPFDGPDSLAILHALALEQPPPPRHINPGVPPALSDLTIRLLAKEPQHRPQSATEVATALEAISRSHLPDGTSPSSVSPARPAKSTSFSRRAIFVAAAALLLLAAPLAAWNAPGVYRFAMNLGQLIIETDDPAVVVTVKQKGELIKIVDTKTGKNVTLKAGTYQLELSGGKKGGLKLETDQFTLTRGGREIARVRRVPPAAPVAAPAIATPPVPPVAATSSSAGSASPPDNLEAAAEPFVLLGRNGQPEQRFATLAEAVAATGSDDTIEIRGNGPFVSDTIKKVQQPTRLTIRAATGFAPVIQVIPESLNPILLAHSGVLILEGLEIQRICKYNPGAHHAAVISCIPGSLHMAHCRFVIHQPRMGEAFRALGCPLCEVHNCLFVLNSDGPLGRIQGTTGARVHLANNVLAGPAGDFEGLTGILIGSADWGAKDISLRMVGNTVLGNPIIASYFPLTHFRPVDGNAGVPRFRMDVSSNVLDVRTGALRSFALPSTDTAADESFIKRVADWREQKNLYPENARFLDLWQVINKKTQRLPTSPRNLADWQNFWGLADTGSLQGRIRYEGGDLAARLATKPESLKPEDFRLHPDSAGKGAREGGRDLGAEVDLVGPGPAYERWKKTPAYQEWLEAIAQTP